MDSPGTVFHKIGVPLPMILFLGTVETFVVVSIIFSWFNSL